MGRQLAVTVKSPSYLSYNLPDLLTSTLPYFAWLPVEHSVSCTIVPGEQTGILRIAHVQTKPGQSTRSNLFLLSLYLMLCTPYGVELSERYFLLLCSDLITTTSKEHSYTMVMSTACGVLDGVALHPRRQKTSPKSGSWASSTPHRRGELRKRSARALRSARSPLCPDTTDRVGSWFTAHGPTVYSLQSPRCGSLRRFGDTDVISLEKSQKASPIQGRTLDAN